MPTPSQSWKDLRAEISDSLRVGCLVQVKERRTKADSGFELNTRHDLFGKVEGQAKVGWLLTDGDAIPDDIISALDTYAESASARQVYRVMVCVIPPDGPQVARTYVPEKKDQDGRWDNDTAQQFSIEDRKSTRLNSSH